MASILEDFGLSAEIAPELLHNIYGHETTNLIVSLTSPAEALRKWLLLLPEKISQQIDLALEQAQPFLPPDVTPEMMSQPNQTVPSMSHMEIIFRCIDLAMKAEDYKMAAALVYVADRASYRYGRSAPLLCVADEIHRISYDSAIAPQVLLRQARVLKDSGDLHTAWRVLEDVISKVRKWDYKSSEQYENTKAVCVQIKGQILHNLGLWKEAIPPLVQSVLSFRMVNDDKGVSSSLALLSRCLKKLGALDYIELQGHYLEMFPAYHPCYEAYKKGLEAVRLIQHLGTTAYIAHNQLVAVESLLMFTILQVDMPERLKLDQYQAIIEEMKQSLVIHRTVHNLQSLEVYLAFVRAAFMISLTLAFSPVAQDKNLAVFLEKLSLELYEYMCKQSGPGENEKHVASLSQTQHSVRLLNSALALLGLPVLEGSNDVDQKEPFRKWSQVQKSENTATDADGEKSSSLQKFHSSESVVSSLSEQESKSFHPSNKYDSSENISSIPDPSAAPSSKAFTFPAAKSGRFQKRGTPISPHQITRPKYVGLTLSKDDLLAATMPNDIITDDVADNIVHTSKHTVDVESLILSADSISAASECRERVTGGSGRSSETVNQSSTTQSLSSVTTDSSNSSAEFSGKKPSESATVDRSASTKGTSSASTDSIGVLSSNSSGLRDSDTSSLPPQGLDKQSNNSREEYSTVDQSADTEPSSNSETTDNTDPGKLSPLVDVSSACNLMSDLNLGESVETNDSSQFLAHFAPSDNKDVHRAVLMTYNPVMGQWSAQTTLAHKGPLLKTATKGANRDAFHVNFLHQDEPLGRYVGKRYRQGHRTPEVYMQDVVCQMLAGFYVTRFNQALQHCPHNILQVQFLSAAHLQFLDKDGKVFDWINVEPFLHGSFLKLTNNLNFVSKDEKNEGGVEVATALSHFSHAETAGSLMMVDMQGWMPSDGKGVVYLTDPVFHTLNLKEFSSGDRHREGMQAFWTNQHARCNKICHYLGLDKARPDKEST